MKKMLNENFFACTCMAFASGTDRYWITRYNSYFLTKINNSCLNKNLYWTVILYDVALMSYCIFHFP